MKKIILVVNEYTSVRNFICDTLIQKGYDSIGVENCDKAFDLLQERPVNLVLTEYNLSGTSGLELLQRIRSNKILEKIPVIFLTTESNPDKIEEAMDAGLTSWIKKPYKAEVFFARIGNALNL
jgi:DNA-binding response OmpR family regulator